MAPKSSNERLATSLSGCQKINVAHGVSAQSMTTARESMVSRMSSLLPAFAVEVPICSEISMVWGMACSRG